MDEKDIAYIKEHQKFRLRVSDYIGYAIFLFLWTLMLTPLVVFGGVGGFVCELPVCYVIFRILEQNRWFRCIATPFAKAQNYKTALDVYKDRDNANIQQFPDYIICTFFSTAFRGRSEITIVPLDNAILINSKGTRLTSIAIVGNRKNIRNFVERLDPLIG